MVIVKYTIVIVNLLIMIFWNYVNCIFGLSAAGPSGRAVSVGTGIGVQDGGEGGESEKNANKKKNPCLSKYVVGNFRSLHVPYAGIRYWIEERQFGAFCINHASNASVGGFQLSESESVS